MGHPRANRMADKRWCHDHPTRAQRIKQMRLAVQCAPSNVVATKANHNYGFRINYK
jgi:hypothetical protein